MTKKAEVKPKSPKKVAVKKQADLPKTKRVPKVYVKKAEPKTTEFDWTEAKKQEAHAELLRMHNRIEPCRKSTLRVVYGADGEATVKGIAKHVYRYNAK